MTTQPLSTVRHSLAHVLAMAVREHYPEAKIATGPATENGFFYDILFPEGQSLAPSDLPKLEKSMRSFLHRDIPFTRRVVTPDEAKKLFADNPFKMEIIESLEREGAEISVYDTLDFTDLCEGPHVESTKGIAIDAFRLTATGGAYFRGDENNPMLTRISGIAFESKKVLEHYLWQQEEAKKRDHRKLGRELKIFTISDLIGAGLPLLQPKGASIRASLEEYLWQLNQEKGYARVWTPHLAKESLYETSGHASKFGDELFRVRGKEDSFILKPMNCPHHMQIFADNQWSYRDMPVRYFEPATVYRDEKSGQLSGLTRVRAITQDDGHLFCRIDQVGQEVGALIDIIKTFYRTFGMEDYRVSLSVRGENKEAFLGDDAIWDKAEAALEEAAKENRLPYVRQAGEAAFYGPKLDFIFKDSLGREWQLATIQCDFNLPLRFDLSFMNAAGEKERPVVIHRAISGSLERFMGIMIEHFSGAFPFWIAPTQIQILPISETEAAYAETVSHALKGAGFRVELDTSSESLGKKIRNAKMEKVPYLLVIGKNEVANKTVTLESRDRGKIGEQTMETVIELLSKENAEKTLGQTVS